ncbi:LuxR family transcriptional regulator [Rhizocola hellebori]|uniref:LuxR family transcriptional regulator n=2 Tax=Rhizocola hellebori TaxID=1392758 RepID=A0A8J3QFK3_9ACTN|nr:LuxR family transcriptional regulator [Rhizocola hellebori]
MQPAGLSQAGLVRWAIDALLEDANTAKVVLAVDDAHLLDPLSAALVYFVARSGMARVFASVRTGETVPDPIRALWTEELAERVDLAPLTESETGALLAEVLGGQVDSGSVGRLWRLSEGNALLLRELVMAAHARAEISESYGIWRWTGAPPMAPSLTEVVDTRIGNLQPDIRAVVEFVAHGEPIGLPLLTQATDARAVERAEELQLIRVVPEGRRVTVRLAHPLYGEVVRRRSPLTRAHRQLATLAELVEKAGAKRRDDLLRVAVWRLDSNTVDNPLPLLGACQQAFASFDMPLACRLGQAALDADREGRFDIAESVAIIMMFADRPDEGLAILDRAESLITDDAQRARWLASRGITTYWGMGDLKSPERLAAGASGLAAPRDRAWVQGVETIMRTHRNDQEGAHAVGLEVLDCAEATPGSKALAGSALSHLRAARGEPLRTLREVAEYQADSAQWRDDTPYFQLALEVARNTAMILAGDLDAVQATIAAEFSGLADAGDFSLGSGMLALVEAQAARLSGNVESAARLARQSLSRLASGQIFAGHAAAELAHALALAGDPAAEEAMADADRLHRQTVAILYPDLERARVWVRAGLGDIDGAVSLLHELIARLTADGFAAYEVFAQHDLVRLGFASEATDRLTELATSVQGALAAPAARHAQAAATNDGCALLAVAEEFAGLGMNLYAAEAAAIAVQALRHQRSPQASTALDRLAALRDLCPAAITPSLLTPKSTLTARERQIARLAAAGVPSKQIAEQIFLSPRTVDNHLLRIYVKLGVNGRAGLAAALRALASPDLQ